MGREREGELLRKEMGIGRKGRGNYKGRRWEWDGKGKGKRMAREGHGKGRISEEQGKNNGMAMRGV